MSETQDYSCVSRFIHWITALLILVLLCVGFYMTSLENTPDKFTIYTLHKSFGLLVLALVIVRIIWHVIKKKPKSLSTHKAWEKFLSHMIHAFLYVAMIALPLSGWIMSSAGEYPVHFFFLFEMPDLVTKDEAVFISSKNAHELFALLITLALGLHILGALKHHMIDRDETLVRMTNRSLGLVKGIVLCTVGLVLLLYPGLYVLHEAVELVWEQEDAEQEQEVQVTPEQLQKEQKEAQAGQWIIDYEKSHLAFQAKQYGEPFGGTFSKFDGMIVFDADHLDQAHAHIEIDISSLDTGSPDRDAQAKSPEWFDAQAFPAAIFKSESFEKSEEGGHYLAHGTLTLRDISMPVDLSFTLKPVDGDDRVVDMHAELTLSRLAFGVGQGQWKDIAVIGDDVIVTIDLRASRAR